MKLAPLVPPRAALSAEEIERYSRHLLLPEMGLEGQRRLKSARVLVIGAGGLGSPVLLYLAAAGVGRIGIVEFDVVEASNLQRQVIHGVSQLGRPKAESAAKALHELNPFVEVRQHGERLEASNALALIDGYDLVIDGSDNFATRYLVNDACVLAGKPSVWGSIFRFEGQTSVFWEDAPAGAGLNYRDLYPEPPPPELAPSCAEGGVLGVLCAAVGSVMATEAIKLITGIGESLLGRLMVYDALEMQWRSLPLRRAKRRQPIVSLIDYPAFCGLPAKPGQAAEAVPSISAELLQAELASAHPPQLIDLREAGEREIACIARARHLPLRELASNAWLAAQARDTPLVLHCKSGARSRQALLDLQGRGFSQVRHLEGGILAWIDAVDTSLPRY